MCLHVFVLSALWFIAVRPDPFFVPTAISVELVELQSAQKETIDHRELAKRTDPPSIIRPRPKPIDAEREVEPLPEPAPETPPLKADKPQDDQLSGNSNTSELQAQQSKPTQIQIPSRWVLEPPLKAERLEGLGLLKSDIDCLRALSDVCKELREDVFADYALSEYEKHVAASTPWSGLGGDFYGLSEQEILEKLNVPIAGQNGLSVPVLGTIIDGPLWDRINGVNKPCKLKPGFAGTNSSQPGRLTVIKDCGRNLRRAD